MSDREVDVTPDVESDTEEVDTLEETMGLTVQLVELLRGYSTPMQLDALSNALILLGHHSLAVLVVHHRKDKYGSH